MPLLDWASCWDQSAYLNVGKHSVRRPSLPCLRRGCFSKMVSLLGSQLSIATFQTTPRGRHGATTDRPPTLSRTQTCIDQRATNLLRHASPHSRSHNHWSSLRSSNLHAANDETQSQGGLLSEVHDSVPTQAHSPSAFQSHVKWMCFCCPFPQSMQPFSA